MHLLLVLLAIASAADRPSMGEVWSGYEACMTEMGHTQIANNMCTGKAYKEADAQLNALWPTVKKGDTAKLVEAQKAWVGFKEQRAVRVESMTGGSMQPMMISMTNFRTTVDRTTVLRRLVDAEAMAKDWTGRFGEQSPADALKAADAELNKTWKRVYDADNDPELLDGQRIWLEVRDAHCAYEEAQGHDKNACLAVLTSIRTAQLPEDVKL